MRIKYIQELMKYRNILIQCKKEFINYELSYKVQQQFETVIEGRPKVKRMKMGDNKVIK